MPSLIDTSTWKSTGVDIVYKDPFSQVTTSIRKKLILFASIAILNYHFPIDLSDSHLVGIHFSSDIAPPLSGLIGLVVLYLIVLLAIYTTQEIKAWLAQANILEFERYKESLHNIYAHSQSIHLAVESAATQLKLHKEYCNVNDINAEIEKIENLNVHLESFSNFVNNLSDSNVKFESEIDEAKVRYERALSDYSAALYTQIIKIGFIEIALPFSLGIIAIYLSYNGAQEIFKVVF